MFVFMIVEWRFFNLFLLQMSQLFEMFYYTSQQHILFLLFELIINKNYSLVHSTLKCKIFLQRKMEHLTKENITISILFLLFFLLDFLISFQI